MWVGIAAKALVGSRLIYDCHELWPDRNGRREWRPWLLACEWLFVRLADAVITTSPGYARKMAGRYRIPPPVVVRNIPSGPSSPAQPVRRELGTAVYLGGLMPGRGLEQVIDAMAMVPDVRVRLIGPGRAEYRAELLHRAQNVGVGDRISLEPPVPPQLVLDAIAPAQVGLMLIQPVCPSYELTLPNKLFEYAAAGLPMLASDLPVIGQVVRQAGLGEVVEPADLEAVAGGLRRLLEADANSTVRRRVRAFAAEVSWTEEQKLLERVYAVTDN